MHYVAKFEGNTWQRIVDTRTLWRQHPCYCFLLPNAPSLQSVCEQRRITGLLLLLHPFRREAAAAAATTEDTQGGRMGPDAAVRSERRSMLAHREAPEQWLTLTGALAAEASAGFSTLESETEGSSIRKLCGAGTVIMFFHLIANWQPPIYWFICAVPKAPIYSQYMVPPFYYRVIMHLLSTYTLVGGIRQQASSKLVAAVLALET